MNEQALLEPALQPPRIVSRGRTGTLEGTAGGAGPDMGPWMWPILGALAALLVPLPAPDSPSPRQRVGYSEFLRALDSGAVSEVRVAEDNLDFKVGEESYSTQQLTAPPELVNKMVAKGVKFSQVERSTSDLLPLLNPLLYAATGIGVFLLNKHEQAASNVGKASVTETLDTSLSFADIAGIDEAKGQVMEVVDIMKNPERYAAVGARVPSGVLLCGPPGTGKTLLARVIAAEAKLPFFFCSGSDFVEMFVGRGAARVRELFDRARRQAPSMVFIDELDALGKARGRGFASHDEGEQTLNQLLACMDGIDSKGGKGVVCVAATNRLDVLDDALCRPGRFDRVIHVGKPDAKGREDVLRVHTRAMPLAPDVDLASVAHKSEGLSPAELSAICNEAAISAARGLRQSVGNADFFHALNAYLTSRTGGGMRVGETNAEEERIAQQTLAWQNLLGVLQGVPRPAD